MPSLHSSSDSALVAAVSSTAMARASEALRRLPARVTGARVAVLALLLETGGALTHGEVEASLAPVDFDRVTLYRVLDWLVATGLADRRVDGRRVFRYQAVAVALDHATHAHFHCDVCGEVFCLNEPLPAPPLLPRGFVAASLNVDVRGTCARCAQAIAESCGSD